MIMLKIFKNNPLKIKFNLAKIFSKSECVQSKLTNFSEF